MDIGANLGYFSVLMSRRAGKYGRVFAIEPVKLFNEIFTGNLAVFGKKNVQLYAFALGAEKGKLLMGTPVKNGVFRHGLTRVLDENQENYAQTYEVAVEVPDETFSSLEKLDFIKCDVEGYETEFFPTFRKTIKKFKPVIQIEVNTVEKRQEIARLLVPLGYQMHGLRNNKLVTLSSHAMYNWDESDLYFVPGS